MSVRREKGGAEGETSNAIGRRVSESCAARDLSLSLWGSLAVCGSTTDERPSDEEKEWK